MRNFRKIIGQKVAKKFRNRKRKRKRKSKRNHTLDFGPEFSGVILTPEKVARKKCMKFCIRKKGKEFFKFFFFWFKEIKFYIWISVQGHSLIFSFFSLNANPPFELKIKKYF